MSQLTFHLAQPCTIQTLLKAPREAKPGLKLPLLSHRQSKGVTEAREGPGSPEWCP